MSSEKQEQEHSKVRERFGFRLREIRLHRGISQEHLADLAGIDRTYVSGCERGLRNIGLENIVKLARGLGCSASELLSNQE